jgi:flagellar assembly protein FliH
VQSALTALHAATEQLFAQRDHWLEQCQAETVRLGVAIAERLLQQTLARHPEAVIDLVRSAIEWSIGADHLSVRLHPADAELVAPAAASLQTETCPKLKFVPDNSLARGDCVLETPNGQIDARREVLTQRIADELLTQ